MSIRDRREPTRLRRTALLVLGATGMVAGMLGVEALIAWTREYLPGDSAPAVDARVGSAGSPRDARPLRLVVLGDSTAGGVGASAPSATVAHRLAEVAAAEAGATVSLCSVAVSGARTGDLDGQVDRAVDLDPDIAVVLVGANDVTHLTRLASVRSSMRGAVGRLRRAGVHVVVGTSPDVGAATALPRPLRDLAGWRSRAVGDAQRDAVRAAHGVSVDLARTTGPTFRAQPDVMLSVDGFHPSDEGYRVWAEVLASPVRAAVRTARGGPDGSSGGAGRP